MRPPSLLIVDDEPNMCRTLSILLADEGRRRVRSALSGREALVAMESEVADVVICDLSMPQMSGLEVLRELGQRFPESRVIMMTAYSTVQSAIEAMRLGAFEYLLKPFDNDELVSTVIKALDYRPPSPTARRLRAQAPDRLGNMVGASLPMQQLFERVRRAAASDATVMISGESGTGKELIARALHELGRRAQRPFVAINCAALTESLLESELFGHERGAFTGAHRTKIGRLEQSHTGTLFLDEIGEMSPAMQTKLLRAIEQQSFTRVGGLQTINVDLRIIGATNRDLAAMVAAGKFREDLYYRLNVVSVTAPPLRDRAGDIALLARLFVAEKSAELGCAERPLSDAALAQLAAHSFPGNVRELENLIERAVVFSDGDELSLDGVGLPTSSVMPRGSDALEKVISGELEGAWQRLSNLVQRLEQGLLERAMRELGDRPNEEIARVLGTSRRILELRMSEHGLSKKR